MTSRSEDQRIARARADKAVALAQECRARGVITATLAERLDQRGRNALAELAGQRRPSPDTWAIVVGLLRSNPGGTSEGSRKAS